MRELTLREATALSLGGREWQGTFARRIYIPHWAKLVGFDLDEYGNGSMDGFPIPSDVTLMTLRSKCFVSGDNITFKLPQEHKEVFDGLARRLVSIFPPLEEDEDVSGYVTVESA
jgi:hypothetical protein